MTNKILIAIVLLIAIAAGVAYFSAGEAEASTRITTSNYSNIITVVSSSANTGGNTSTGGDITTGDAVATSSVTNVQNTNRTCVTKERRGRTVTRCR